MVSRALAIVCVLASAAWADRPVRSVVVQPRAAFTAAGPESPFIYLNRCVGDCTVTGSSTNDARTQQSSIPGAGTYTLHELANFMGSTGANGNCYGGSHNTAPCTSDTPCMGDTCNVAAGTCNANAQVSCTADDECNGFCDIADVTWAAVVQCMTEVYSPYAVTVTDQLPSQTYTEAIVAGLPDELGQAANVLGIAPIASDCSAVNDAISFTFANNHPGAGPSRALDMCWTVSQETAHVFGLDHEFQFVSAFPVNDNSACMDPMTYRTDCGGEKFFRNADAMCGETATRDCRCHGTQNSHQKVLSVFGAGQSLIAAPSVTIVGTPAPRQGAPWAVAATAGSKRGVLSVELWLNNYPWATLPGAIFGADGQVDPGNYPLVAPANVPPGTIDVMVKAYDDLGVEGDSSVVTVQNGPPCTDASLCALGQSCNDGRCEWPTPVGALGDSCPYPQYCTSGVCSPGKNPYCTETCLVGKAQACPSGYECSQISGSNGYCSPASGGCCSAADAGGAIWVHAGLAAVVVGLVTRRRRRAQA